jgi:hypothetical protein
VAGPFVRAKMRRDIVPQRVEHSMFVLLIFRVGPEVTFEQVASGTGINQVVVAVVAASGHGLVVVNRQFAPGVHF